jgi:MinD-like ATPase involved in chromosome partitioning or flagellar assembly
MTGVAQERVGVLLAAGAAPWEEEALERLAAPGRLVLLKRCLDLHELLATASRGSARVAVVSDQLPGVDADCLDRLNQAGVRTVVVTGPAAGRVAPDDEVASRSRLLRMGASRVLAAEAVSTLPRLVLAAADEDGPIAAAPRDLSEADTDRLEDVRSAGRGRLLVVWGPGGAPGRTTVATGIAAVAAASGRRVTLLDADPYGGAVAQHLAVLEDVSGLLSAARLANGGELDPARLAGLAREVAPRLRLLTGLPRPDRWTEVRTQAFHQLLTAAVELDDVVVVDSGFGLPTGPADPFAGAARDDMTVAALERADAIVVVAAADPVGLTRLARGLREMLDTGPDADVTVVVNRMRAGLGWSEREVIGLVSRVAPGVPVRFLPDDRATADRALVAGRTLVEVGDTPLRRAVTGLATEVVGTGGAVDSGGRRRRRFRRQHEGRTGGRRARRRDGSVAVS